jgi:hypothetical protein
MQRSIKGHYGSGHQRFSQTRDKTSAKLIVAPFSALSSVPTFWVANTARPFFLGSLA